MNFANVKGLAGKGTLIALALGAAIFAAAPKAQAQVSFGVQVGAPAYAYPQPAYYGAPRFSNREAFFGPGPYSAIERRDAIIRHEEFERARRFDDRRFDHRFDRRWR